MMPNTMTVRRWSTAACGLGVVLIGAAIANAQGAVKTVWSGIYTTEQTQRGKAVYDEQCASCHGGSLTGGDVAPPLVGSAFLNNWNNTSAGDLFERIRTTMPQSNPGSLSGRQVSDVEAYMFKVNGFPAGQVALPPAQAMMAGMKIVATKPAG